MSIFKQPSTMPERAPVRLDTPPAPAEPGSGTSVIGPGMKVVGDVETTGILKVEGTVHGSIRGARQVLLGRTGVIQGDVQAEEIVLGGRIVGTVTASERVEIQSNSVIEGDVHTRSIVVFEGGILNGNVRMDSGTAKVNVTPSQVTPLRTVQGAD
ncbi:MAG: polymer-forming cytoskeletal protein [Gemmatimonadaceae bacterium]|nr:polymer-forming cytoskeletal protein [Gemmatimonadaceae bacterium]